MLINLTEEEIRLLCSDMQSVAGEWPIGHEAIQRRIVLTRKLQSFIGPIDTRWLEDELQYSKED